MLDQRHLFCEQRVGRSTAIKLRNFLNKYKELCMRSVIQYSSLRAVAKQPRSIFVMSTDLGCFATARNDVFLITSQSYNLMAVVRRSHCLR